MIKIKIFCSGKEHRQQIVLSVYTNYDRFSILVIGTGSLSLAITGVDVIVSLATPFTKLVLRPLLSLGEGVRTICALPPAEVFDAAVTVLFDDDETIEFVRVLLPVEDGFLLLLLLLLPPFM